MLKNARFVNAQMYIKIDDLGVSEFNILIDLKMKMGCYPIKDKQPKNLK